MSALRLSQRSQEPVTDPTAAAGDAGALGRGPHHCGGFCQLGRFGKTKQWRLPKKNIKEWPNPFLSFGLLVVRSLPPPLVNTENLHLLLVHY